MNESRLTTTLKFYLLATKLKYKIRAGWDKQHWNVDKERIESVAEHVYGACILAIGLDSEYNCHIDLNRVLKMLIIHELGEVIIGDITPYDNISKAEKARMEYTAFESIVGNLCKKEELLSLMNEFDEHKTKESLFAYHCDKLEADIQAKFYQDTGCLNLENSIESNVAFKKDHIKQIVSNGANTVFDIWYQCDKNLFEEDTIFSEFLDYLKDNNINV